MSEPLLARIRQLERANQRWKWFCFSLASALALLLALWGALGLDMVYRGESARLRYQREAELQRHFAEVEQRRAQVAAEEAKLAQQRAELERARAEQARRQEDDRP